MAWAAWVVVVAGCQPSEAVEVRAWELTTEQDEKPSLVVLPAHLDAQLGPRDQSYELAAEHRLPRALVGRDLDFVIPHLWANTMLWVDGEAAARLRESTVQGHRTTGPHVYRIPARATSDGRLSLRLRVAHRWTQSAWLDVPPRLTPAGVSDRGAATARLFNDPISLFAMASLLQIGIAAIAVYIVDRRRRVYFWFGIQAITAAVYPMFVYGLTQPLFGRGEVAVVAAGLTGAVWASGHFSYAFFELGRLPRIIDVVAGVLLAFSLAGLDPYLATKWAGLATILSVAIAILLQSGLCIHLTMIPEKRRDARWYLLCWTALALTCWNEMVTWGGLGDVFAGARVACAGLVGFSFFLSLLLSQRHMTSLRESDRLNEELGERVAELERHGREIDHLNVELRRQIAERSEQIYAALALRERGPVESSQLAVDEIVQNRYRVLALRASGGMGSVYEVERMQDGVRLALKVARETHGDALALLAREAQVAAQIAHPNLVRVVDVDISATRGFLFLVMELVEGRPLNELSASFGVNVWSFSVLRQVAAGLAVLHEAGIVHRDLKPANILVSEQAGQGACAKIVDFGIARFEARADAPRVQRTASGTPPPQWPVASAEQDDRTDVIMPASDERGVRGSGSTSSGPLTRAGHIAGTPAYMAPELAAPDARATGAADVFSFGIVAWELLTRNRPFARPLAMAKMLGEELPPLPSLARLLPSLGDELASTIEACLSELPEARPSAVAVVAAFDRALAERGERVPSVRPSLRA